MARADLGAHLFQAPQVPGAARGCQPFASCCLGGIFQAKLAWRPLHLPSNQIIFLVKIKIRIAGDCQMEGTAPHTSFFKGRKQAKCKLRLMQYIQEGEIRLNVMYVPRGLLQAREERE